MQERNTRWGAWKPPWTRNTLSSALPACLLMIYTVQLHLAHRCNASPHKCWAHSNIASACFISICFCFHLFFISFVFSMIVWLHSGLLIWFCCLYFVLSPVYIYWLLLWILSIFLFVRVVFCLVLLWVVSGTTTDFWVLGISIVSSVFSFNITM